MKLENQYCSPEQSKQIIGHGIDGSSTYFIWVSGDFCDFALIRRDSNTVGWNSHYEVYPAFSVAELSMMHPSNTTKYDYHNENWKFSTPLGANINRTHPTQAKALAQELIYYLSARTKVVMNECNERLKTA